MIILANILKSISYYRCMLTTFRLLTMTTGNIEYMGGHTVSPRGHLFYVDFLFFIFTSHRGGNVSTAVRSKKKI